MKRLACSCYGLEIEKLRWLITAILKPSLILFIRHIGNLENVKRFLVDSSLANHVAI